MKKDIIKNSHSLLYSTPQHSRTPAGNAILVDLWPPLMVPPDVWSFMSQDMITRLQETSRLHLLRIELCQQALGWRLRLVSVS